MPKRDRGQQENTFNAKYAAPQNLDEARVINSRTQMESRIEALDQALTDHLQLKLGSDDQKRLYYLDENNQLQNLEDRDLLNEQGRDFALKMLNTNRLFAVPAGENSPVQLQTDEKGQKITFADNLDEEPEKPGLLKQFLNRWFGFFQADFDKYNQKMEEIAPRLSIIKPVKEERVKEGFGDTKEASAEAGQIEVQLHGLNKDSHKDDLQKESKIIEVKQEYVQQQAISNRMDTAMDVMHSIYGSHPQSRECFNIDAGKNCTNKLYTAEQFSHLQTYELGLEASGTAHKAPANGEKINLTEDDFVALSVSGATLPEIAGKITNGSEDDKALDPTVRADQFGNMYTADLMNTQYGVTTARENLGGYFASGVQPGREAAAKAIEEYRNNNPEPLGMLIANGLAFYSRNYIDQDQGKSKNMGMTRCANQLVDLMEKDETLKKAAEKAAGKIVESFSDIEKTSKGLLNAFNESKENAWLEPMGKTLSNAAKIDSAQRELDLNVKLQSANPSADPLKKKEMEAQLSKYNVMLKDAKKNVKSEIEAHPTYFDKLTEKGKLMTRVMASENNTTFNLLKCADQVKINMGVGQLIENADKAKTELMKSQAEDKPIAEDKKKEHIYAMLAPGFVEMRVAEEREKSEPQREAFKQQEDISPFFAKPFDMDKEQKTKFNEANRVGGAICAQNNIRFLTTPKEVQAFRDPEKGIENAIEFVKASVTKSQMDQYLKMDSLSLRKDLTDSKKSLIKCIRGKATEDAALKKQKELVEKAKSFEMNKNKNLGTNEKTFDDV